jgi:hypothetical protein
VNSTPDPVEVVVPVDRPQLTPRGHRALFRILIVASENATETEEAA